MSKTPQKTINHQISPPPYWATKNNTNIEIFFRYFHGITQTNQRILVHRDICWWCCWLKVVCSWVINDQSSNNLLVFCVDPVRFLQTPFPNQEDPLSGLKLFLWIDLKGKFTFYQDPFCWRHNLYYYFQNTSTFSQVFIWCHCIYFWVKE